jgi:hypothetical protein
MGSLAARHYAGFEIVAVTRAVRGIYRLFDVLITVMMMAPGNRD